MGLDISQPLIREAQRRAVARNSRATFALGDAAGWRGPSTFDALVSRLGVMFFDDPVGAFANMLQLSEPGGRLSFTCWCSAKESDLGVGLMKAVAPLFAKPSAPPDPTAPGPYAFADRDRVAAVLSDAGWRGAVIERWDGDLPLPGANLRESALFATRLGSIGRLMREHDVAVDRVADALTPFLEERMQGGHVVLRGAAWLVSAQRG